MSNHRGSPACGGQGDASCTNVSSGSSSSGCCGEQVNIIGNTGIADNQLGRSSHFERSTPRSGGGGTTSEGCTERSSSSNRFRIADKVWDRTGYRFCNSSSKSVDKSHVSQSSSEKSLVNRTGNSNHSSQRSSVFLCSNNNKNGNNNDA